MVVFVVGVVLFSGSVVFLLTESSDRHDADPARRNADHLLQNARLEESESKGKLDVVRTDGGINASASARIRRPRPTRSAHRSNAQMPWPCSTTPRSMR